MIVSDTLDNAEVKNFAKGPDHELQKSYSRIVTFFGGVSDEYFRSSSGKLYR